MYSVPGVVICLAISFSYRLVRVPPGVGLAISFFLEFFSCTAFQGLL